MVLKTRVAMTGLLVVFALSAVVTATAAAKNQQPEWRVNSKVLWEGTVETKLAISKTPEHEQFVFKTKISLVNVEVKCKAIGSKFFVKGNEKGHGLGKAEIPMTECTTNLSNCTVKMTPAKQFRASLWLNGSRINKEKEKEKEGEEKGGKSIVIALEPEFKEPFVKIKLEGGACALAGEYSVSGATGAKIEPENMETKTIKLKWQEPNGIAVHQKEDTGNVEQEKSIILRLNEVAVVQLSGDILMTLPVQEVELDL